MSDRPSQTGEILGNPITLRELLGEILTSPAFKGSRRSQQFLQHIVNRTIDGRADELKERNLGVELFARPATYDTGEDAIVRVTASDVRKRLQQFYLVNNPEIRIELVSGSYTPEFRRVELTVVEPKQIAEVKHPAKVGRPWGRVALCGAAALLILASLGLWARQHSANLSVGNISPWSRILKPNRQTVLVLSDPDISAAQSLMAAPLSLSDYANGNYWPNLGAFSPDLQRSLRTMRGANVPAVDVATALNIDRLAQTVTAQVKTSPARTLKLADFKTDGDFILLGSPRSNPWSGLFQDQLDFDFVYDGGQEVIRNKSVRPGEKVSYIPTTRGWGTGQAFAIVALLTNPGQSGSILLLAGTQAEGTEAAGKLVTNLEALTRTLEKCAVKQGDSQGNFEMLLEVHTMAGSPNTFDVAACHVLTNQPKP